MTAVSPNIRAVFPIFKRNNITSFFCGFIGCFTEFGRVWVRAGMSYGKNGRMKWKVPGGDGEPYEMPLDVGYREGREEITRPNSKVELDLRETDFIHQAYGMCEKHPGG